MAVLTVGELKEILAGIDDDVRVVLQRDREGNGYRWASGAAQDGLVVEEHAWMPEIYDVNWDATEADMDEDEWNELQKQKPVLVMFPIN